MASYRTSAAGGSTSGTGNRTATITPAVGDLLVVFCGVSVNTNTSPTCSDDNTNGSGWSLVDVAVKNTSADTLSCFVRNALMTNTTSTTVTVATGSNTAGAVHLYAISGMNRTGLDAIRQAINEDNQSADTPNPAFASSCLTGNLTLGCIFNATNPAGMTAPTNWTEQQDTGFSTPATGLESVSRDSGFTGTTVIWNSASASASCNILVELDATTMDFMGAQLGAT